MPDGHLEKTVKYYKMDDSVRKVELTPAISVQLDGNASESFGVKVRTVENDRK